MIYFPLRKGHPETTNAVLSSTEVSMLTPLTVDVVAEEKGASNDPLDHNVLASQFVSTDQEKADYLSLPNRYRRKTPREWEMDSINVSFNIKILTVVSFS